MTSKIHHTTLEHCLTFLHTLKAPVVYLQSREDIRMAVGQSLPEAVVCHAAAMPDALESMAFYTERLGQWAKVCAQNPPILCAHPWAVAEVWPHHTWMKTHTYTLKSGTTDSLAHIVQSLQGYVREDTVWQPGSFALRGHIIDIFSPAYGAPVRYQVKEGKIFFFDPETQRRYGDPLEAVMIPPASCLTSMGQEKAQNLLMTQEDVPPFFEQKSESLPWHGLRLETIASRYSRAVWVVDQASMEAFHDLSLFKQKNALLGEKYQTLTVSQWPQVIVTHLSMKPLPQSTPDKAQPPKNFWHFHAKDYLIHKTHGVGCFQGITFVHQQDFFTLVYRNEAVLYVPIHQGHMLSFYASSEQQTVVCDVLGGKQWTKRRERAEERVALLAQNLVHMQALRQKNPAPVFHDASVKERLHQTFPFQETADQNQVLQDIYQDLSRGYPMDRVVCGDVGCGKTELAVRAATVVANAGYQVVVLVPTVLLAKQHVQTFRQRLQEFSDIQVHEVTRTSAVVDWQATGIFIGTHGLLQGQFSQVALCILDEEQHFGVEQKEVLKHLSPQVHVLTLSATPLPRTLHMSLSGLRDFSLMRQKPNHCKPVHITVQECHMPTLNHALRYEKQRQGQTFFVCPFVHHLDQWRAYLTQHHSDLTWTVLHGKLPGKEFHKITQTLSHYDVILCTNIVESGLDYPSTNTIIVMHSQHFGLSNLYQLKGRVGRHHTQGKAYIFYDSGHISGPRKKMLHLLERLTGDQSHITLAQHDMTHRGFGNVVGAQQSGYVKDIGVELYQRMLSHALTGGTESWVVALHIPLEAYIPKAYIPDASLRLALYQEIGLLSSQSAWHDLVESWKDRFGEPIPFQVHNLGILHDIKVLCQFWGIVRIEAKSTGVLGWMHPDKGHLLPCLAALSQSSATLKAHMVFQKQRWMWKTEFTPHIAQKIHKLLTYWHEQRDTFTWQESPNGDRE